MILKSIRLFISYLIISIRPLLGPALCYYPIGCTQFALMQLKNKNKPLYRVLWTITCRVLSCNPFTRFFGLCHTDQD